MSEDTQVPTPNPAQQQLINSTEGVYLVDAGPGTGKTFAITRRYASIVEQDGVEPDDILLVTFTRSAAREMRDRIVDHCPYELRDLVDAPIQTFHAHCLDLLRQFGYSAPTYLGLDEHLTDSTRVLENELVEGQRFAAFFDRFQDDHPEHAAFYRSVSDPTALLDVLNQLAAKGIFPTADGWYRDGRSHLEGNMEAFAACFEAKNQPRNDGRKQSRLRSQLSRYGNRKTYLPDAPEKTAIRGSRGTKQVDPEVAELVFEADREALFAFVHNVYLEYLRFALRRNYLNFGFLQLFAFVLLCENPAVRECAQREYVMIDEFQDTSEIQFKLALLLAGDDNFCVVGDWKQSIYSFQSADVDNIREFDDRLRRFVADLNNDQDRVVLDPDSVTPIQLTENYRSTSAIIDLSEEALQVPAASNDAVSPSVLDDVASLESNATCEETTIRAVTSEDEPEAICSLVQDVIGNDEYAIEDAGEIRPPERGDIAVFTRTRAFGRELIEAAKTSNLPMAYDGGVELVRTDQAKLALAWLRIVESNDERGWAVVLERAGYSFDELEYMLGEARYPDEFEAFRERLIAAETIGALVRQVLDRYGFTSVYADVLVDELQSLYESTDSTRGELIQYIERGIEHGTTVEVQASAGDDAVTVQTIHAAKGLEYPIVIMANMNAGAFPPRSSDSAVIQYMDEAGLRQRKLYSTVGPEPHVYDNWRYDVISRCLGRGYDEERRLLYVAITRAEQHVLFTAGGEPNTFLEELPVAIEDYEPAVDAAEVQKQVQAELPFTVRPPAGPIGHSPHSLMDESVFEDEDVDREVALDEDERGLTRGARVHEFAEDYANGVAEPPSDQDEGHVAAFLDGLDGEKLVEKPVTLPLTVDGQRVTISGLVDLVHVTDDTVEVIDYKTDRTRRAESEYRLQVSIYYHVLDAWYPDKDVIPSLFYTHEGQVVDIDPIDQAGIEAIVRETRPDQAG